MSATQQTFTISQALATVTITCTATSVVYTGLAQTPCGTTATVTGPGGLNTTTPLVYTNNVDVATVESTSAATATATYAGSANYLATSVFKTFRISKAASVTVAVASPTVAYSATLPTITATAPAGGFNSNPTCGVYATAASTTALTGAQNAGSYVTKCSGGVAVNYTAVTYVNGTLTITKGNVFVTAQSAAGARNGNIPTPTYTTNPTGVTFTTAPTCKVYASTDTTYTTPLTGKFPAVAAVYVTRCTGAVSTNYTPTYVNGTITVA